MNANPVHFFLVDDDEDDSALFADVLAEVDPSILLTTASDGDQALRQLRGETKNPDLLFLDLNMPRMGGRECLKQLKADQALREIPVIVYTTSSQGRDVEETLAGGAAGFITKPVSIKDLKFILLAFAETGPGEWKATLQRLRSESGTYVVY